MKIFILVFVLVCGGSHIANAKKSLGDERGNGVENITSDDLTAWFNNLQGASELPIKICQKSENSFPVGKSERKALIEKSFQKWEDYTKEKFSPPDSRFVFKRERGFDHLLWQQR